MSDEKAHVPAIVICLGDRLDRNNKLTQYWSVMVDGKPGDSYWSWSKPVKGAVPGAIYTFWLTAPMGEQGSARIMGGEHAPKFERMYHMQDTLAEYQAKHKAAHISKNAFSREKKEKSRDALKERLAPITSAYLRAGTQERAAIIALVIRYIMGG